MKNASRCGIFLAILFTAALSVLTPYITEAAAGDLDVSFSGDGKQTVKFGTGWTAIHDVLSHNGKVIAVGVHENSNNTGSIAIARLNSNGSLDPTFGVNGKVLVNIARAGYAEPLAAIIQDSKILVAGNFMFPNNYNAILLARFVRNGALDSTFGSNGIVLMSQPYEAMASDIALQSDGKIVVSISSIDDSYYRVARFDGNGTLDTTFGLNGIAELNYSSSIASCRSVAIQADGKIIVGGDVNVNGYVFVSLARFNIDGGLDLSFGSNGYIIFDPLVGNEYCSDIAIEAQGKIVLAGTTSAGLNKDFLISRFNFDGSVDTSFGVNGTVVVNFQNFDDQGGKALLETNGRIIVSGSSFKVANATDVSFAAVRLLNDGVLDSSFGVGGKVITDFSDGQDFCYGARIQSDGKLVLAGTMKFQLFAIARYLTQ
jgi:uncharacterized delta-60 repeat protein